MAPALQLHSFAHGDQGPDQAGEAWQEDAQGAEEPGPCGSQGKILLVLNHPSQVSLALRGHPGALPGSFEDETGILGWFLTELEKDIKVLLEKPQQPQAKSSHESLESEPQDEEKQKAIDEGLERLRGHHKVCSATWLPSMWVLQGHQEGQEHL